MSLLISAASAILAPAILGQVSPLASPQPELSAFPQTAPLLSTLRWSYTLGRTEGEPGSGRSGLIPITIEGAVGALPPGTTKVDGALMRAAYGLRAWGKDLKQTAWVQAADKMALAVAASHIIDGQKAVLPKGVTNGAPDLLQGVGYASLFAFNFPESPAATELKRQADVWVKEKLDGRFPLSINEFGCLAFASQTWAEGAAERSRLSEMALTTAKRLEAESRTVGDQFALAQALLDTFPLLSRDGRESTERMAKAQMDKALAFQTFENDERTTPIPTKGLLGLAGERPCFEAWHVASVLQYGAAQSTPDVFRRGVLMLRGLMGLVSQPTGAENGLWQDDLFVGRLAPTPWMLTRDGSKSWPGFAMAEGQLMTSLYHIHQRYGSLFHSSRGWSEPVEALTLTKDGPISLLRQQEVPYSGFFKLVEVAGANRVNLPQPPAAPLAVRPLAVASDGSSFYVVARPTFVQTPNRPLKPKGVFTLPNGKKAPAVLGDRGFEIRVAAKDLQGATYRFSGSAGGAVFSSSAHLSVAAPTRREDWTLMGGPAWNGFDALEGLVGTGSKELMRLRGQALSRSFAAGKIDIAFSAGEGTEVRLEDTETGEILRSLRSGAGRSKVTLDFSRDRTRLLRLRLVDNSLKGYAALYSVAVRRP